MGSKTSDARYSMQDTRLRPYIVVITVFSAIGGFISGYNLGIMSGAMVLLKKQFNISIVWQELIVSTAVGSAAVASLAGGILCDLLGRRPVILSASAMFTVGAFALSLAPDKEVLLVAQLIIGFGIGLTATSVPVFIAETAPSHSRELLVGLYVCFYEAGTATSGVVAGAFSFYSWGWRGMFGIAALPAITRLIAFLFLPESPSWLIRHGKYQSAIDVLERVNGPQQAEVEYERIRMAEMEQGRIQQNLEGKSVVLRVLQRPGVWKALLVGCGLHFIQQFAGINTIVYYNGTIIRMAGVESDVLTLWLAAVTSSCLFFATTVGLYLIQKVNRRMLTLASLAGLIVSLVFVGSAFLLISISAPPATFKNPYAGSCSAYSYCSECILQKSCGFCYLDGEYSFANKTASCLPVDKNDFTHSTVGLCSEANKTSNAIWALDFCPSSFGYIVLIGMLAYLVSFGLGMANLPWIINTELYPTWARSFCNGCASATSWISNLIVSMTFLSLIHAITHQGFFLLAAGVTVLGFFILFTYLPETKHKPIEEITHFFARPMCTFCEQSTDYKKLDSSGEEQRPNSCNSDLGIDLQ